MPDIAPFDIEPDIEPLDIDPDIDPLAAAPVFFLAFGLAWSLIEPDMEPFDIEPDMEPEELDMEPLALDWAKAGMARPVVIKASTASLVIFFIALSPA